MCNLYTVNNSLFTWINKMRPFDSARIGRLSVDLDAKIAVLAIRMKFGLGTWLNYHFTAKPQALPTAI